MPMVWDDAAIARLCCGILATTEVKVDHKKLADYMGPECTHRAVEFPVQNMKKAQKALGLVSALSKSTPSKSTGKRKATKEASDDGADDTGTPSKQAKQSMNKGHDDGGDGGNKA